MLSANQNWEKFEVSVWVACYRCYDQVKLDLPYGLFYSNCISLCFCEIICTCFHSAGPKLYHLLVKLRLTFCSLHFIARHTFIILKSFIQNQKHLAKSTRNIKRRMTFRQHQSSFPASPLLIYIQITVFIIFYFIGRRRQ